MIFDGGKEPQRRKYMGLFESMLKMSLDFQRNWQFDKRSQYDEDSNSLIIDMQNFQYVFTNVDREMFEKVLRQNPTYDGLGPVFGYLFENGAEDNTGLHDLLKAIAALQRRKGVQGNAEMRGIN
jgi:hypothetical protein